jgi:hypothetical protein
MSYKDEFEIWYNDFEDENGREPTTEECEEFWDCYRENASDLADCIRKQEKEGV